MSFIAVIHYGFVLKKLHKKYHSEPEPEPEPEPEKPDPDEYLKWIEAHTPALPSVAKKEYLKAAKEVIDQYEKERFAPTTDELVLERRKKETLYKTLAQAKYTMYDEYKKLAEAMTKPDGYPPFPLWPVDGTAYRALYLFGDALRPLLSWSFRREDRPAHPLEQTPFAPLVESYPQWIQNGVKRFEGTFILAPSGSGKTTLLNYLIDCDFDYLADEYPPSVIAMDSTGDFLRGQLPRPQFQPDNGTHLSRLIIIEPDVEQPIAINPFAFARKRMKSHSPREKEKMANTTIELLSNAFSTMGEGAKFTPRQALLFRHCVRLCLAIPDSNLQTLANILTRASVADYYQYIPNLEEAAVNFFQYEFSTQDFKKVCGEVSWRLSAVLENTTFAKMMNAPDCKVDFFEALNSGSFVIINTDRALLGDERSSIFGRLMLALIRIAMRERDTIPEDHRPPVYFYIDEAHEIFDNDSQVASMIDDVRKSRLALTFVTQRLAKIKDANVKDALLSCGILLARPTPEDAVTVARYMNTDASLLTNLRDRTYIIAARGVTGAVDIRIPYFNPDRSKDLSMAEQRRARQIVKDRYGYTPGERTTPPPEQKKPTEPKPLPKSKRL